MTTPAPSAPADVPADQHQAALDRIAELQAQVAQQQQPQPTPSTPSTPPAAPADTTAAATPASSSQGNPQQQDKPKPASVKAGDFVQFTAHGAAGDTTQHGYVVGNETPDEGDPYVLVVPLGQAVALTPDQLVDPDKQ